MTEDIPLARNERVTQAALRALHDQAFSWSLSQTDRNRAEAEDVLQTVYEHIVTGKARFDGRAALRTWLFAVIRRVARRRRRSQILRDLLLRKWSEDATPTSAPAASQHADVDADCRLVRRAMANLSRRQRAILELVFYRDLSIEESAKVLGISLGSARTHYARAKDALAAVLPQSEPL
jgi:RNA polymerase sigma-70 factor, ECF subfamily